MPKMKKKSMRKMLDEIPQDFVNDQKYMLRVLHTVMQNSVDIEKLQKKIKEIDERNKMLWQQHDALYTIAVTHQQLDKRLEKLKKEIDDE